MMIDKPSSNTQFYKIRIKGHLDAQWMTWFDGLTIMLEENGETLLLTHLVEKLKNQAKVI